MKYLFFDTETTGLPKNFKAPFTETNNWPRIVQLAWILSDGDQVLCESNRIIKVDFPIPIESSRIHGITNEVSLAKGQMIESVLIDFLEDAQEADFLVCHNLNFDLTVLKAELYRAQLNTDLRKNMFCTMKSTVDYCKLPGQYGFKWPKLEELYNICFQEKLENAHDAMVDVQATFRIFNKLRTDLIFRI